MAAPMDPTEATVSLPVRQVEKARSWYENLLGKRPDLEPIPGIVEFKVGGTWLQLEEGTPGAARFVFRIGVRSLEQERSRLVRMGIPVGEVETVPNVIRFCDFADPDGNPLSLYELLGAPSP
jgi:catechol 2,3-dioxygenase-like lactoylglutathione lyase family enzyme